MAQSATGTPNLTFRPAEAADWPAAERVIEHTWPEGDYITQDLWAKWTTTANGQMIAAEDGTTMVGFGRLTELGQGDWWIEGIRVDSAHRGKGYGRAIVSHLVSTFGKIGFGLLRFMTSSQNTPMIQIAPAFGFKHIQSYSPLEGPTATGDYRNYKLLQRSNLELMRAYLKRSPMNRINHFVERDLTFYYLNHERIEAYLADPTIQVLGWRQAEQLNGIAIVFAPLQAAPGIELMPIGYLDAADDTTFNLMLAGLHGLALKGGYRKIGWAMPRAMGLERSVVATALAPAWGEEDMWLFERPLTAGLAPALDI